MSKNRYILLLAGLVFVLTLAWHFLWSASTPNGQPPLARLSPAIGREFVDQFNQAAANARMVLLLSPT